MRNKKESELVKTKMTSMAGGVTTDVLLEKNKALEAEVARLRKDYQDECVRSSARLKALEFYAEPFLLARVNANSDFNRDIGTTAREAIAATKKAGGKDGCPV